ncbi:hypothetical protein ACH5RR_008226 [Cinchona calisaya]|uniref:Uncharacterized protein n=1 Tax=Cinchona calisaya TaxID=153742 RepID=A0ABD3ACI7_9GENT
MHYARENEVSQCSFLAKYTVQFGTGLQQNVHYHFAAIFWFSSTIDSQLASIPLLCLKKHLLQGAKYNLSPKAENNVTAIFQEKLSQSHRNHGEI